MKLKHRFWLFRREGGGYYLQDAETGKRTSLRTTNRIEAQRLRDARNQAAEQPALNLALGKAYLAAIDPALANRTWETVIEEFCVHGKESTRIRNQRATSGKHFAPLRQKKLVETTADDLRLALKNMGAFDNHILRCLHNLAVGLGWLPWPIIPPKLWPQAKEKPKRAITLAEHQKIIGSEKDPERRHYYELLWEIGASQSDAARLCAEHIDWRGRTLTYVRSKTGEAACLVMGSKLEALLQKLPTAGFLFPKQASLTASDRAAEFSRRCRVAEVKGVSLHSYRYSWAQRALQCAYPERFAQEALGHASKAVHRAYARGGTVKIPPLEHFEKQAEGNVIPVAFPNDTAGDARHGCSDECEPHKRPLQEPRNQQI